MRSDPRVLVVRLSALGDLVHTLPMVAALRRGYPGARIDWLVDRRFEALVDLVTVIDRRIALDTSAPSIMYSVLSDLRRQRYDIVLDAQGLLKSALVARLAGARRVVGFHRNDLREPAARWLHTEHAPEASPGHVIERNLRLVSHLGVRTGAWEFPLGASSASVVARVRDGLGVTDSDRFVLMNPGTTWASKGWKPECYGTLAARLAAECGFPSVVTWGPGERQVAEHVVRSSHDAARLAPATGIAELVEAMRLASLFVGGDTGPLHLAAAVGTPVVGVYGPSDPARNGPWAPDDVDVVVSRFSACACARARRASGSRGVVVRRCREPRPCLEDVSPDDVLEAARQRLGIYQ